MADDRGTRLGPRFEDALVYAARAHASQWRKETGIPYVSHLLAVAGLVLEDGGDEDEAIAALLHDAAEDQGGRERLEDIRGRFGDRVAAIVEACTDSFETPKPSWRRRKERYVAHLVTASPEAVRVSLADKLHNARAILRDYRGLGERLWPRFHAGREDQLWYYHAVVEAIRGRTRSPMLAELEETIAELERLRPEA